MKKFLKFVLLGAIISLGVSSCTKLDDMLFGSPKKVVLNPTSIEMIIGDSKTIKATVESENGNKILSPITWTTSDEKVATVANGVVTAIGSGEATITATTKNGIKAICAVNVGNKGIPAVGVTIENDETTIEIGGTLELDFSLIPADANTENEITWESTDDDVATVEDGIVTGVAKGEVTIKASISNGVSAKVKVIVNPLPYVIASEMVGTWRCVKLQARYTTDGTIYEEDNMDKLFKIEGVTKEEWCQKIKDAVSFVSAADNTIVWSVPLKDDKTKEIVGTITRDDEVENQFFVNYHTAESGINFGDRQADYDHIKLNWLPETSNAVYDEPGGSFYDFIYTCEIVAGDQLKTIKRTITLEQLKSFKCAK